MKRLLLLLAFVLFALPVAAPQNINVARAARRRGCEVHIWGSGAAGALTATTDNEPASCRNTTTVPLTITKVSCWADAGSPTIMPTNEGVSGHNILSGNLTCGTASFADGSLTATGTDLVIAAGGTIGIGIVAGSTAKSIRVVIESKL